ncbi:MAG TPA: FAD-binding oxidoreductase [Vicinamibacterales bacterium]
MNEYPYWWDTLPSGQGAGISTPHRPGRAGQLPVNVPPLPARADVVVVGAGYTGLAAARHLAHSGASVLVIERETIGWGASSRNGGQVLTGMKLDPGTLVARFGEARARELFEIANASIARLEALVATEAIDCEFERVGHIQLAWKPAHFAAFRDEQSLLARVFAHRVELISSGSHRAEIGSDRYHGVMVDERSGAINPARYVSGLAGAATRCGATIAEGVAVNAVDRGGDRWRVATTAGVVEAANVLFATNGYTNGAFPDLKRRFLPIGSYIIATEPLEASQAQALLPRRRMAFDSKNFLYYFRVTPDRRLLFGGRAEFGRPGPDTTRRAAAILREGMADVFPELRGTAIEYGWGGNVAFTRDQMPRAGLLGGLFYAGGYCGHGVAMATYLGEQIGRRMAGEAIDHPLFDDRFPAIPGYSGSPWFLPLVGAYYQLMDWIQ